MKTRTKDILLLLGIVCAVLCSVMMMLHVMLQFVTANRPPAFEHSPPAATTASQPATMPAGSLQARTELHMMIVEAMQENARIGKEIELEGKEDAKSRERLMRLRNKVRRNELFISNAESVLELHRMAMRLLKKAESKHAAPASQPAKQGVKGECHE